jgi:uncharacterized protein (DUF2267 family)
MTDKEMEGDSRRRRALARDAREHGRNASETGVTLGASKQPEPVPDKRRAGPPAAGTNKPRPGTGGPPPPAPNPPDWPRHPAAGPAEPGPLRYRDLVSDVARRTGLDFDGAKQAAEATVTVLARALAEPERQRLLAAVPAELRDDYAVEPPDRLEDLAGFIGEVARIAHGTPEQARIRAEAVLGALGERAPDLVGSLDLPPSIEALVQAPPAGGGLVDAAGHPAPLTDAELRTELARLPYWAGSRRAISRTVTGPPDRVDRLLLGLAGRKADWQRGPRFSRPAPDTAIMVLKTSGPDAVTALDIDLAHRLEGTIAEALANLG